MAKSHREQVVDAIVGELKKIDGSGSYETRLNEVLKHDLFFEDSPGAASVAGVFCGSEEFIRQSDFDYSATGEDRLFVNVRLLVRDSRNTARAKMDKTIADVRRTVFDDRTLGITGLSVRTFRVEQPEEMPDGESSALRALMSIETSTVTTADSPEG